MSDVAFEPGDRVYTLEGRLVEYRANDGRHGFFVRPVFRPGTEHEYLGEVMSVSAVFEDAPTDVYDERVENLIAKIETLTGEAKILDAEVARRRKETGEAFKTIISHEKLTRLVDFIEGKITHVLIEDHETFAVKPAGDFEDKEDDWGRRGKCKLPLLTLWGDSDGDLTWKINRYRDGSGDWRTVTPFCSEAEARAALVKAVEAIFASPENDPSTNKFHKSLWRAVHAAEREAIPIPDFVRQRRRENAIATYQKQVETHRRNLEVALSNLQAAEAR